MRVPYVVVLAMKDLILLLRPHQWLKNLFVFLPLFFDRHLLDAAFLQSAAMAFLAYSLAASGIYCFNDIHDVESDRRHPEKCHRPVASGSVSKSLAYGLMAVCFVASFAIIACAAMVFTVIPDANAPGTVALQGAPDANALGTVAFQGTMLAVVIAFYIVMNIAYCVRLKHIALVDVFTIALGFVLRIMAGGFATGVRLSHWIVLMTFLLALFLAIAKRRDDVVRFEESGVMVRDILSRYSVAFINQALAIVGSITIVCYIMYTVSPEVMERFNSQYVYVTSLFVLAGIIRYLQLTIVDVKSGSPTKVLLKDHFIHTCLVGWIAAFVIILYF